MKWVRVLNSRQRPLEMQSTSGVCMCLDKNFGAMEDLRRKNQEVTDLQCKSIVVVKCLEHLDDNNEMILFVLTIVKTQTWI